MGGRVFAPRAEPPYTVLVTDMIWACFTVDRSKLLPTMPAGLTPIPETLAFLAAWRVPSGWGLAPSTGCFFAIPVVEYQSPDTTEACWQTGGYISSAIQPQIDAEYAEYAPGEYHVTYTADLMSGSVVSGGKEIVRVVTRPNTPDVPGFASIDRYIGRPRTAELTSFYISVTGTSRGAELVSFEITDDAPSHLQALRPVELHWAQCISFMPTTWGIPQPLVPASAPMAASRDALLSLFDRYGRAACVVRTTGEVVHINDAAARLVGAELARRGASIRFHPAEQDRFLSALRTAAARSGGTVPTHFAMTMSDRPGTIIVQIAPVDPVIAGPDAALVFLTDPADVVQPAPIEALQLLGLTLAEARAAALVGGGLAPREAASRLGVAEPTIRSALRIAYEKLGIARQSELVQMVARLAFV